MHDLPWSGVQSFRHCVSDELIKIGRFDLMKFDNQRYAAFREKLDKLLNRAAGVVAAIGGIYGFGHGTTSSGRFNFWDSLLAAAGSALLSVIVFGLAVQIPAYTALQSLEYVKREKHPFLQGFKFVLVLCLILTFTYSMFDFALTGGSLLYLPIFHLIFNGTLEGTYWDCVDWVIQMEAAYCADDTYSD